MMVVAELCFLLFLCVFTLVASFQRGCWGPEMKGLASPGTHVPPRRPALPVMAAVPRPCPVPRRGR